MVPDGPGGSHHGICLGSYPLPSTNGSEPFPSPGPGHTMSSPTPGRGVRCDRQGIRHDGGRPAHDRDGRGTRRRSSSGQEGLETGDGFGKTRGRRSGGRQHHDPRPARGPGGGLTPPRPAPGRSGTAVVGVPGTTCTTGRSPARAGRAVRTGPGAPPVTSPRSEDTPTFSRSNTACGVQKGSTGVRDWGSGLVVGQWTLGPHPRPLTECHPTPSAPGLSRSVGGFRRVVVLTDPGLGHFTVGVGWTSRV